MKVNILNRMMAAVVISALTLVGLTVPASAQGAQKDPQKQQQKQQRKQEKREQQQQQTPPEAHGSTIPPE